MKKLIFFTLIIATNCATLNAQLILQHKNKKRVKNINFENKYLVKTKGKTYSLNNAKYNDSSFVIYKNVKTGQDSTYITAYTNSKNEVITKSKKHPLYNLDSFTLLFKDIISIKKFVIQSKKLPYIFLVTGAGVVGNILFLPFTAIFNGRKGVNEWLKTETILITLTTNGYFLLTRKRIFNTQKRWTFVIKKP